MYRNYIWKISKIMFFLNIFSYFGGQELETTSASQENPPNHANPTKQLHQIISKHPEFVVFPDFFSGFDGQGLESTIKNGKIQCKP